MALHHLDIEGGLRRLADRRIEDAIKKGKFSNLRGMGQPLELEEMPVEENARMTWWALRLMRQNDFTPHEVQWRKQLDLLREAIDKMDDESKLPALVNRANEIVRKLNTLGTNALPTGWAPLDPQHERAKLRERLAQRNVKT